MSFLTEEEKLTYKNRPCISCKHLREDEIAPYGYCNKYDKWNPTKCKEDK